MTTTLVNRVPFDLLKHLARGETNITSLFRETGITYSHTTQLINIFERYGLVKTIKKGRTRFVKITKEGKTILDMLSLLKTGGRLI